MRLLQLFFISVSNAVLHVAAKWVVGQTSLSPKQARVVTKFCFDFKANCEKGNPGIGPCAGPSHPGNMDLIFYGASRTDGGGAKNKSPIAPEIYVALLDDEYFSFPEVSQIWGEANCTDVVHASKKSVRLEWDRIQTQSGQSISIPVAEKIRPRWWYLAVVACSNEAYDVSYSMHLQNTLRGWQSEFSMDEMGLCWTTICFFVMFGCLAKAQLDALRHWQALQSSHRNHKAQLHSAVLVITACVAFSFLGQASWLIYSWNYMATGNTLKLLDALGRIGSVVAKTLMQILLMLLARGQCVCTPHIMWNEHLELVGGMACFGCLSLILELYGDSEFQNTTTEFIYDTRPGCALVAFDAFWFWMYATRSLQTFRGETRPKPRYFYSRYGIGFGLWFAVLPFLAVLARVLAAWVRFGVTFAVYGLVHFAALAVLVYSFHPDVAAELYELRAHECESALDEAELSRFLKDSDQEYDEDL